MRVLVVLQDEEHDAEVVTATQRLVGPADDVHLLLVLPVVAARETVSTVGAPQALFSTSIPTGTGELMSSHLTRPVAAKSETHAAERLIARGRMRLSSYAARFPVGSDEAMDVRLGKDLTVIVQDAARRVRPHGVAIGEAVRSGPLAWLRGDPVQRLVRELDVPVLIVQRRAHIPRSVAPDRVAPPSGAAAAARAL